MDDFGFGEDPFDAQLEEDCAVLDEIEHDLGKSYIADRVNPAESAAFNPLQGQTFSNDNNNHHLDNNIDEDEEKQIELMDEDLSEDGDTNNNGNKPFKRSRKRKRSVDHSGDFLDLSTLPNTKRARTNNCKYTSTIPQNDLLINELDEIYLHGRPSLNDNTSVMITDDMHCGGGQQLYIYYDSYGKYQRDIKQCLKEFKKSNFSLNNLGIFAQNKSIDELMDEIENERIAQEVQELSTNFIDLEKNDRNSKLSEPPQTLLWTDKYAPNRMTQLLSSEQINREVTAWVKQWDYIVFGHKYRRKQHRDNNKFVSKKENKTKNVKKKINVFSVRNNISMFSRNKPANHNKTNHVKSKRKRPEIAVLLFCGPPGTGKSTLAHIVANHCGYRPFEINASNDRSGKKLSQVIINAATMKPMFGDTRPPLIIMDEIDGALRGNGDNKSAVDVILNIVRDANKYYNDKDKNRHNKKKKNLKIVNRPIICICNNEYSAALRPLRAICKVYKFRAINTHILCNRLLDVCRKELVHTDLKTLSYLSSITNNDVRSCLHTLQFFKQRSKGGKRLSTRLNIDLLTNIPIGRKDKTQNIFDVWAKILKSKKEKTVANGKRDKWREICSMIYGFGGSNDNKIMDGVVENYLGLGYVDPLFRITFECAQLIEQYDELKRIINHKKQFILMGYLPFLMIAIHEQCATETFKKLQYPSNAYKNRVKYKENMNIVQQFLFNQSDISTTRKVNESENDNVTFDVCQYASILARGFNINSCVTELIPSVPFLIFTQKRWNNNDFDNNNSKYDGYKNNQNNHQFQVSTKSHFISIINTMIECGLNYIKSEKSSNCLQLKPAVHNLSIYAFSKPEYKELAQFKYINEYLKEKIAHQIILEIMRRNEAGANKYIQRGDIMDGDEEEDDNNNNYNKTMTPFMSSKKNKKISSRLFNYNKLNTPSGSGRYGNDNDHRQSQPSQTPSKFKNFIASHNRQSKVEKYEYPVQYKFVEGYTNAVKRKSFCRDWI